MKTRMNQNTAFALSAIATALMLASLPAHAADECGPGPTVTCTGAKPAGVTYVSPVNFTLTTTGSINAGTVGFDITGTGTAGISFTPGASISGNGGVDLVTNSGNISAILRNLSISGGLRATSTSGDIEIVRLANSSTPITAIGGGDITIRTGDEWGTLSNQTSGRITVDSSSGTGATYILNRSGESGQSSSIQGLDATVGAGGLVVDVLGLGPVEGGLSPIGAINGQSSLTGGIVLRGVGAAEINLEREGFFYVPPNFGNGGEIKLDTEYARMSGAFDASQLQGGLTVNVGFGGAWEIGQNLVLSPTDDLVRVGAGGFLHSPIYTANGLPFETFAIDFGGGSDNRLEIAQGGFLLIGTLQDPGSPDIPGLITVVGRGSYEAEVRFQNLQTFVNDGDIWFGTSVLQDGTYAGLFPEQMIRYQGTDQVADDMLVMPGTTFIGSPTGRLYMDADLNALGSPQAACSSALRAANGNLPVADCISMENGRVEGTVLIAMTPTSAGGRGAFNPEGNVIIDMSDGNGGPGSGGGLAEGAVVGFAPESRFYNPALGGIIDNGLFSYQLFYDENTTQIKLIGVPSAGAFHQPIIANAAQSAWRTANGSFFDRQADLRDTLRASSIQDHGVWLRTSYDDGERQSRHVFSIPAGDITYDNTHDLQTSAVTLGVDAIRGGSGDGRWLVGAMLGYVRTDIEYAKDWTDTAAMNGMMAGLYGSWVSGPMFIDGTLSGTWTRLVQDMPQAELFRDRNLSSDIETRGAQVEAGWRFDLGVVRVEPLLSATWSQTSMDDIKVPEADPIGPGNQIMFEDTTSTRVGGGLRGSTQFPIFGNVQLGLSLTGRFMSETDGEAKAAIGNLNPVSPEVVDTWDGTFSEFIGGVTLANSTGRVSGVLNVGLRSGDDYSAVSGSFGFRYQW